MRLFFLLSLLLILIDPAGTNSPLLAISILCLLTQTSFPSNSSTITMRSATGGTNSFITHQLLPFQSRLDLALSVSGTQHFNFTKYSVLFDK